MTLTVLGIETSCDETAAAVIRLDPAKPDGPGWILSNCIHSQTEAHAPYGGVVPEIAARSHVSIVDGLVETALREAGVALDGLDGIAATAGPGLAGGLMVGLMTGKTLALSTGKPFVGVNHLAGHALTVRLCSGVAFPYLLLLASGGHCQLVAVRGAGQYETYGSTLDDAAGEAFDKAAKLMGLGYPGGPAVEKLSETGDENRFDLPRPLSGDGSCRFSFSGLKTALRVRASALQPVSRQDLADLAASFQNAVTDCLTERSRNAMQVFSRANGASRPALRFAVAGGVAANARINAALTRLCAENGFEFHVAPPELCTDNAAMIAWAGAERLLAGEADPLDMGVRPRWPLSGISENQERGFQKNKRRRGRDPSAL